MSVSCNSFYEFSIYQLSNKKNIYLTLTFNIEGGNFHLFIWSGFPFKKQIEVKLTEQIHLSTSRAVDAMNALAKQRLDETHDRLQQAEDRIEAEVKRLKLLQSKSSMSVGSPIEQVGDNYLLCEILVFFIYIRVSCLKWLPQLTGASKRLKQRRRLRSTWQTVPTYIYC